MMKTATHSHNRNAALDGLRAIAVGSVFAYHLFPTFVPGGFLGVDVFFVLSGFLITSLLIRERALTGDVSLRHFWVRRARRILPAAFTVMLVTCAVTLVVSPDLRVGLGMQVLGILTFSTNWVQILTASSYFDAQVPQLFVHYWSLAIEEQFYLVWPLLFLGLWAGMKALRLDPARHPRPTAAFIAALAAGSAAIMAFGFTPGEDPSNLYYGTHSHAFGLLLGASLAVVLTSTHPSKLASRWVGDRLSWRTESTWNFLTAIAGIALVVGFFALQDTSALAFRWGIFAMSVAAAVLIAACALHRGVVATWMMHPGLVWVGQRSFSLYLWHWPAIVITQDLLSSPTAKQSGLAPVVAIVVAVVLSALSYSFIELPFQRRGYRGVLAQFSRPREEGPRRALTARTAAAAGPQRMSALRPVGVSAIAAVLVVCGGLSAYAVSSAPQKTELEQQLEQIQSTSRSSASGADAPADTAPPEPKELPSGDQISVIGDSVALGSTEAFVRAFPGMSDSQVNAEVSRSYLAVPGIIAQLQDSGILRRVVVLALGANGPAGRQYVDDALDAIGPDHLVVVVNAYSPHPANEAINEGIAEAVQGRDNVEMADWYTAISPRPDLLAADQLHPANEEGRDLYATTVREALQRLVNRQP